MLFHFHLTNDVLKHASQYYERALERSNYVSLLYTNDKPTNTPSTKRKRQRNIIWFNPPYSKFVNTNIAQNFLKLLEKHFPKTSRLHKSFNRNNVKVSYSCMPNVKGTISHHNNHILAKSATNSTSRNCNCRNSNECPLEGNCLAINIVYKAQITSSSDERTKQYIGRYNTFTIVCHAGGRWKWGKRDFRSHVGSRRVARDNQTDDGLF